MIRDTINDMSLKRRGSKLKSLFVFFMGLGFFISGGILLWAAVLPMPDLNTFDSRVVEQSTKIYDRTGEVLLYDFHENVQRTVVPFEDISHHLKNATVAIEDAEFYKHLGIYAYKKEFLLKYTRGSSILAVLACVVLLSQVT